jgi:hypothetical protein
LRAVEDIDDTLAGFLAGEVGEDDGGDVGVVDEAVDNADAGVVDYDLGVVALACDVDDQLVGCWVGLWRLYGSARWIFFSVRSFVCTYDIRAIPAFRSDLVDEHDTDLRSRVHGRLE